MKQIEIRGFVPGNFKDKEFSMRVEDATEIENFYIEEKIDTKLRYAGGYPIISVRGELASKCNPNDRILLSLESYFRAGKKCIRSTGIKKLS